MTSNISSYFTEISFVLLLLFISMMTGRHERSERIIGLVSGNTNIVSNVPTRI